MTTTKPECQLPNKPCLSHPRPPPPLLKWVFWPFARPRPSPPKSQFGIWREGGGGTKNQIFSQKPVHPSKLVFWPFGGLGARVAKSKNQICNLVFRPVSKRPSSLEWAFWPFATPPSKPPNSQFAFWEGRAGGGHQNSNPLP